MKKSVKPILLLALVYIITITLFILGYISVKLKCEELTKQKVLAEEELENKKNWKLNLTAQYQSLTSEDRIAPIAEDELGMIKPAEPPLVLYVDKNKIEEISKIIKDKYE
jgi:cell division protein FtsB